jgi:hypothetical protein
LATGVVNAYIELVASLFKPGQHRYKRGIRSNRETLKNVQGFFIIYGRIDLRMAGPTGYIMLLQDNHLACEGNFG